MWFFFFFQAEDGIRDRTVTGVQTCALPISPTVPSVAAAGARSSRIGRPQLPHLGRSVMRVRSTRLSVPHNGQTTVARLLTSVTDTAHLHRESDRKSVV